MVTIAARDVPFAGGSVEWTSGKVELGLLAVGEYDVNVQASRCVPRELGGSVQNVFEPVARFRSRLRVERGSPAVCHLEPSGDR